MKNFFISILFALIYVQTFAQRQPITVTGQLKDSTGITVIGATIKLVSISDTVLTSSDIDGNFTFKNIKSPVFTLFISSLGFISISISYCLECQE